MDPLNGTVVINPDGTYTYTPNPGFTGPDKFSYLVCDDGTPQACAQATVYLTVLPVNNPPFAVNDDNITLVDVAVTGNILTNDFDPDGNNLFLNVIPLSGTDHGSLFLNNDGSYTYLPDLGFIGQDQFTYAICDDGLPRPLCDTAVVRIIVIPGLIDSTVNNQVIAMDDDNLTLVNTAVSGELLSNDLDPDGDNLTVTVVPVSFPANGMVTLNPDGTYLYIPNPDYTGMDSFKYEVCDDGTPKTCDTATVFIYVIPDNGPQNDPPFAADDAGLTFVNRAVQGDLLENDTDPNGDPISINTIPVSGPAHGNVVIYPDGTYSYLPGMGYSGPDQFTYEICDNGIPPLCDTATVYIIILPVPTVFPIELLDFSARLIDDDGHLYWTTSQEIGSDYFAIERSFDGQAFNELANVDARGGAMPTDYTFTDIDIAKAEVPKVYYRLKMVDLDGSYSRSHVVELNIDPSEKVFIRAYPNPVVDLLNLEIYNHQERIIQLQLIDMKGTQVFYKEFLPESTDYERIELNLERLSQGMYYYTVTLEEQTLGGKFIKIR
jgi:hypothetical protein